jgi:hypothetical protein
MLKRVNKPYKNVDQENRQYQFHVFSSLTIVS